MDPGEGAQLPALHVVLGPRQFLGFQELIGLQSKLWDGHNKINSVVTEIYKKQKKS